MQLKLCVVDLLDYTWLLLHEAEARMAEVSCNNNGVVGEYVSDESPTLGSYYYVSNATYTSHDKFLHTINFRLVIQKTLRDR